MAFAACRFSCRGRNSTTWNSNATSIPTCAASAPMSVRRSSDLPGNREDIYAIRLAIGDLLFDWLQGALRQSRIMVANFGDSRSGRGVTFALMRRKFISERSWLRPATRCKVSTNATKATRTAPVRRRHGGACRRADALGFG